MCGRWSSCRSGNRNAPRRGVACGAHARRSAVGCFQAVSVFSCWPQWAGRISSCRPNAAVGRAARPGGAGQVLRRTLRPPGAAQHLSGMTVAVVRDGEVLLVRGYGYADIAKRTAVDPEHTLFRIGSITNTFTWTAVMQLVAEGRLDVNAPIDQFLTDELDIRSPWGASPTLRDLMTHTPGYEDVPVVGLFRHAPYPGSLRDALLEIQPVIVRQPGTLVSYSNYGSAQAGYVVERISGVNWDSYVESQILKPLGMEDATFAQPLPPELAPHIATGYRWSDGAFRPQGFEYVPLAPAGAGSASAAAMARFMLAHLQDGRYGDARIMPEWTARQMREPLYRAAPQVGAWLHGFCELRPAGPRVYGQSGSTLWFHSLMALFPESNTGLFFSFNSDTGKLARDQVYKAFLEPVLPAAHPETARLASRRRRARAAPVRGGSSRHACPGARRRGSAHSGRRCRSNKTARAGWSSLGRRFRTRSILSSWNHGSTGKCAAGNARFPQSRQGQAEIGLLVRESRRRVRAHRLRAEPAVSDRDWRIGRSGDSVAVRLPGCPVALQNAAPPCGHRGPSGARGVLDCRGGFRRGHRRVRHLSSGCAADLFRAAGLAGRGPVVRAGRLRAGGGFGGLRRDAMGPRLRRPGRSHRPHSWRCSARARWPCGRRAGVCWVNRPVKTCRPS